ncbi:MAG: fibronectin type III domain-containing protein, partial [Candidatus Colwellbacteria bacterium]|nr:fibronectin type III domain-containing protein [Candidatus Colwellbacteria bacterium]
YSGSYASQCTTTLNLPPNAPAGLSASATAATSITVSWATPADNGSPITNYKIYRATSPAPTTLLTTVGVVNSYIDSTVATNTTYYYRFKATSGAGDSAYSADLVYAALGLTFNATSSGYTGTIQNWTVPFNGTFTIDTAGAQGGNASSYGYTGGLGARIKGDVVLTSGTVLKILVGQAGGTSTYGYEGGGGGGTFVTNSANVAIMVAGGGGGASGSGSGIAGTTSTSGAYDQASGCAPGSGGSGGQGCSNAAGGGGLTGNSGYGSNASHIGYSFTNGGQGGISQYGYSANGGFGGGGATHGAGWGGAGGGGYSGGSAYTWSYAGGGGGSYNSGANQTNTAGYRSGNGFAMFSNYPGYTPPVSMLDSGAGTGYTCSSCTNAQHALAACQSKYGTCASGSCGSFTYYYRSGALSCDCNKPVGEYEWIYNNTGYTTVGSDYGGQSTSVSGDSLFTRMKSSSTCDSNSWTLTLLNLGTATR